MNIRYSLLLFPLIYVVLPYLLNGNLILLGAISGSSFLIGVVMFIVISNLDISGNIEALTVGGGAKLSLNGEGSHSLFVVFVGGLFYFGALFISTFTIILDIIMSILKAILFIPSLIVGINVDIISSSAFSSLGLSNSYSLTQWYNTAYTIPNTGISIFGSLGVVMSLLFCIGLWLMISSRGN